jgi:hypothetical protein
MISVKALDIYDVAKPLHICSKLIGLTSFSIKKINGIYCGSVEIYSIFSIVFSTLWYTCVVCLLLTEPDAMWTMKIVTFSGVFEKSMYIVVLSFILISTISNLWFFVRRKTMLEFFNKIVEIDEHLIEMKVPVDLSDQKRFILLFILFVKILSWSAVVATEVLGQTTGAFRTNLAMIITMAVNVQMWIFVNCQFICLIYSLRLRFERINLFL